MILSFQDVKVKLGDKLLTGTIESEAVELRHGVVYDAATMLDIPSSWSHVGASLCFDAVPPNFEVQIDNETVEYTSPFADKAVVTVNYFPDEHRIYFAIEKKEQAADFPVGLHQLVSISFRLSGFRFYVDIQKRD